MPETGSRATSTREPTPPEPETPWLLRTKVTPPEPPEGYFHRPALLRQLDPSANRRVSVLRAPGGFGKTTTLAEVARRAGKQGALVAWLTVDEDDAPGLFGAHLAYAFEHAGLDPLRASENAWTATPLTHQIGMLVRAIEAHATRCLLIVDELERLPVESVDLLERLVRRGPRNLHFALSFRTNPGLDLAGIVLEGSAVVVTTEQFRLTKPEIGRFVGGNLTRQELTETLDRTAGWPVAVRIDRTIRMTGSAQGIELGKAITRNFLDARLLRRLSDRDRALLLDLAVFDWIDTNLVDEVLETTDTQLRLDGLLALDGLVTPVGRDGAVRRLHPVVRQHCLRLLAGEDPARMRHLHHRTAEALARRDQLIPAWRHAAATGDREFLGNMMERVGVFRMWLREGLTCLAAADRFLTPELMEDFPRLALIRCVARRLRLQFDEAGALYRATRPRLDAMARRRGEGYLPAMLIDRLFTEVSLVGAHFRSKSDGVRAEIEAHARGSATTETTPLLACGLHTSRCVSDYQTARFETCRQHGLAALSLMAQGGFRHGEVFINLHLGMAAMSQGRVQEAADRYAIARRITKACFATDAALATIIDALVIELDIERDRAKAIEQRTLTGLTELRGAWLDAHAAAIAVAAELSSARHGTEFGIQFLADEIAKVRAMGLTTIVRYASTLRSLFLLEAGRPDGAEQVWRDERLPTDVSDLIDLDRRSWREVEALSCARIRLLIELGDRDAARDLANRLRRISSQLGLTRTLMRALVLSMVVEAGADGALEPLVEFLRLTRSTDYLRPLVRHRDVSRRLLTRLLEGDPDPEVRDAATTALARLEGPAAGSGIPAFSAREQAVLAELRKGLRNREIADQLRISEDGVRHHLKNIYRKTGTRDRSEAVSRAMSMGLRL